MRSLAVAPARCEGRALTGPVCTTSFSVRFIHVSHCTRWPLSVSPFLSSTSIGWPWAALSRPRGSYNGVSGVSSAGAVLELLLFAYHCVIVGARGVVMPCFGRVLDAGRWMLGASLSGGAALLGEWRR